jgi:hypothetical protein
MASAGRAVGRRPHLVAGHLQHLGGAEQRVLVVVHQQHPHGRRVTSASAGPPLAA